MVDGCDFETLADGCDFETLAQKISLFAFQNLREDWLAGLFTDFESFSKAATSLTITEMRSHYPKFKMTRNQILGFKYKARKWAQLIQKQHPEHEIMKKKADNMGKEARAFYKMIFVQLKMGAGGKLSSSQLHQEADKVLSTWTEYQLDPKQKTKLPFEKWLSQALHPIVASWVKGIEPEKSKSFSLLKELPQSTAILSNSNSRTDTELLHNGPCVIDLVEPNSVEPDHVESEPNHVQPSVVEPATSILSNSFSNDTFRYVEPTHMDVENWLSSGVSKEKLKLEKPSNSSRDNVKRSSKSFFGTNQSNFHKSKVMSLKAYQREYKAVYPEKTYTKAAEMERVSKFVKIPSNSFFSAPSSNLVEETSGLEEMHLEHTFGSEKMLSSEKILLTEENVSSFQTSASVTLVALVDAGNKNSSGLCV